MTADELPTITRLMDQDGHPCVNLAEDVMIVSLIYRDGRVQTVGSPDLSLLATADALGQVAERTLDLAMQQVQVTDKGQQAVEDGEPHE
jgi:hypothetical protein